MKKYILLSFFMLITTSYSQEEILALWQKEIPNSKPSNETETITKKGIQWIEKVQIPTLAVYLPAKNNATGKAIVICPGGGYGGLAYDWEGTDIAKWLNAKGIAAFVLKYRLPKSEAVLKGHKAPLQDAKRAIKLVRKNAKKWHIKENEIGIMGFSAGGHLAATLGTHYKDKKEPIIDTVDTISPKPNFMILIYPVITMNANHTHQGSKNNLLGNTPTKELINYYSNELQVTQNTPPTFIIHAANDKVVPVENSLLFYKALLKENIYTEMHLYPEGGHGFSLAINKGHLQSWTERLSEWLQSLK